MKRLIYIDQLKGFGILAVLFLHTVYPKRSSIYRYPSLATRSLATLFPYAIFCICQWL